MSTLFEDFGFAGIKCRIGMDASAAIGIVQRSGLNRMRHVELDVLWIQEQQARRLLPLRRVPGPRNPSDVMMKHVDLSRTEQHIHFLNLRFADGRADIAQQLHYFHGKESQSVRVSDDDQSKPVNAHNLGHSVSLESKSGPGSESSRDRSNINSSLLAHYRVVADASRKASDRGLDRLYFNNFHNTNAKEVPDDNAKEREGASKAGKGKQEKIEKIAGKAGKAERAAERHVDSWGRDGAEGRWTRIHRTARRALFTPFTVAGGPGSKVPLKRLRITRGQFVSTNKTFKIIDDWSVRANAYRMLEGAWIGTTDFGEASEFIEDDSDEETEVQRQNEEEMEPGDVAKAATPRGGEADNVERFDLSTPPEKSDPVARQLFSAALARQAFRHPSDSTRERQSEGECEDGRTVLPHMRPLACILGESREPQPRASPTPNSQAFWRKCVGRRALLNF